MKRFVFAFMFLCGVAFATPTTTITIPNSFTPNTTIQSSQVNANFTETQNQYNSHTHTDITSLGSITTGTWLGTPVATTYGGTGQNFGAVVQGSVIYFSGAGTTTTLAPSTSGYVLTTKGAGANPEWTGGAARHVIESGFEASGSVGGAYIEVFGGSLYNGTTGVEVATSTILRLSDASDWSSGSVVSYAGAAGWCYIGVSNTASVTNKGVFLLGDAAPGYSNTPGTNSGMGLYSYDGTKWYRVIGAVRIATTDLIAYGFRQSGNRIILDEPPQITAAVAAAWTTIDCSAYIPKISSHATFGCHSSHAGAQAGTHLRPLGSTADLSGSPEDGVYGTNYGNGELNCALGVNIADWSQNIQYVNDAGDGAASIRLKQYQLSIR